MIKRFILYILLCIQIAYAQRQSTFENWFSASVQHKIDNATLTLEEGWRVREFTFSRQNYTDLNFAWKFNKYLEASAGYRLVFKDHMFSYLQVNNRVYVDLTGSVEPVKDLEVSLRTRFQYTQLGHDDDMVWPSQNYFRNKLKVKYGFNKDFSAGASWEVMTLMDPSEKFVNENRVIFELGYRINKKNIIGLGYIFRNYINVNNPLNIHILNIEYTFKI